jgi:predicted O-methyltransferase YrrM
MGFLRLRDRALFYRSRLLRELAAFAHPRRRRGAPDVAHLAYYDELSWGPVQRDEALFLHGLVRAVRPQTVVEIGFLRGASAFNFLRALDDGARLYSFDIDPASAEVARSRFGHDRRLFYRERSQDAITAQDIDGRVAEFVFLDAAHDLALNQATFEKLLPLMAEDAILAVHDTGWFHPAVMPDHWTRDVGPERAAQGLEHQPEERAFVNWVLETHPEFSQVHIHSRRTMRHGMTLIQRGGPLTRPSE